MTNGAAAIRTEVLAQHRRLRGQLRDLRLEAERTVRAGAGQRPDLRAMLQRLLDALTAHLAYEDEHLLPLLGARNPFGYPYAALLHDEHQRQRQELLTIARQAADPDDLVSLALAIAAFAADVMLDMDDEELQFLTPHRLADGSERARHVGR
jgi:iron-sulfur cluster repair protein YtfE (RIC family)